MKKIELYMDFTLPRLKQMKMLKNLSDNEIKKIIDLGNFIHYESGEIIIQQGKTHPYFYGVLKGRVKVCVKK